MSKPPLRVAVAQPTAVLLDLDRAIDVAIDWIGRAASAGAALIAFPESFLGGYPVWVDWPGWSDFTSEPAARLYARLRAAALEIDSAPARRLAAAARQAGIAVAIGANERTAVGRSLYNSLLFFDRRGELVGVHRKLVPTHGERLCWTGAPDAAAAGLGAVEIAGTRVGGLICWEHWMPLARHALHRTAESVHVAAWPHGNELHQIASRHFAFEGACFVLCAATWLEPADIARLELGLDAPRSFSGLGGGSAIIAPDASYLVQPARTGEELLVADLDLEWCERAAFRLDTAGHYDRVELSR